MNFRFLVLVLAGTVLLPALASAAPEITAPQDRFDFGSIEQGKKVTHSFEIRNSGDALLQIREVDASCGCTEATASAALVPPGSSARVKVVFDSSDFSGKVQESINVVTNAANQPNYPLSIEGRVEEMVQIAPRQVNLGTMKPGAAKMVILTVTNKGKAGLRLFSLRPDSTSLDMKGVIRSTRLKPGASTTIAVTVVARPGARVLSGYLHLVTSNKDKKEFSVPVYGAPAR